MAKSNNFSNNLFFVKFALKYDIDPLVNIIIGLLDETEDDIQEGMDNLHFLRFFYSKEEDSLYHDYVTLVISRMSKYFGMLSKEEKEEYTINDITYLLPEPFSNHKDRFNLFSWKKPNITFADKWNELQEHEKHYIENAYRYKVELNSGVYNFKEYCNDKLIVDFDLLDAYWSVLQLANDRVIKFTDLLAAINQQHPELTSKQLLTILEKLKAMHLIYCNRDFDNVITVIDVGGF